VGAAILVPAALAGICVAAGAFTALIVSEYTPLFGFMESGYRLAIELSLLFEGLATLLLATFIGAVALDRREDSRAGDSSRVGAARRQPKRPRSITGREKAA
jgi:NADH:ubiquinone oxidoreductase subunit 6 (subunit J)